MNKKRTYILFLLLLIPLSKTFSQGGTWTWINGDSTGSSTGVFGTQGMPSANNHPPGFYEPCEWKDKQGNFWIYGGTIGYPDCYSDLWKYNPITNEWTWMQGTGLEDQPPVYGTMGVPNALNSPGNRAFGVPTWVDTSGALWLMGGYNDDNGSLPALNDLWKYDIGTNEWTWVAGEINGNAPGVHGVHGMPSSSNIPGARGETASAWTDSSNNLWLFGGWGYDDNDSYGPLNDLCKYDISTNEWTWMKGSAYISAPGSYGSKGVPDTGNVPGARFSYTKWKDVQGNFWLMGGAFNSGNNYNDVWKYDLNMNEWTWMSGSNLADNKGIYGANCVFDTVNIPYSRYENRLAVTDSCGRFWLFGGVNEAGATYEFNDLWVFDPQQLKWNWLSGSNVPNQTGNYGTIGVPSSSNIPPSRSGGVAWWGNDNKFYMFGGSLLNGTGCDVWVFTPDTNCISVCGAVNFPPPIANVQSSSKILCANDCINFTDLSTNATTWQWTFAGAADSTSTAENPQFICYLKSGIYNVTLIASNATGSDTVTFGNYITVNPTPPPPVIKQHQNHDTLYCSTDPSYISYQWYFDSTLIAGATDTFLVISKSGNYNTEVTNGYGCKISVGINIVLGIQNYINDNFVSLSPNPVTDELTISGNWQAETDLKMTILNVLGEIIYTEEHINKLKTLDCKPFSSGIYFVQVANESERWVGKFVKE